MKKLAQWIFLLVLIFAVPKEMVAHENTTATIKKDVGSVTGKVIDSDGMPIPYASVELIDEEGNLIDGILTEGDGSFILTNKAFGTYKLKIIVAGANPYEQIVEISAEQTNLGDIVLSDDVVHLDAVEARGEVSKIRTEIDKRVIEVGKDLISAGATAGEVLNNIPSLNVDQQSGALSLRGNSNVRVFVDGKPSNIPVSQLLKQLPSNSISKVEIITNPSAKYDPDGNSGIINIVTNKEKRKGYNIGTNLGFTKANREKYNASINGNINTGKFNLFGNYNTNFGQGYFRGDLRNFDTGFAQQFALPSDFESHLTKFGIDWFINDKTALTVYTNQNWFDNQTRNRSNIFNGMSNSLDTNTSDSDNRNSDYSLNFKRDFEKEGHSIELDAFYSDGSGEEVSVFSWESAGISSDGEDLRNYLQTNDSGRDQTRIRLDYTLPFKEKGKIEAGYQFLDEGSNNDFLTNQQATNLDGMAFDLPDLAFDFTRQINAAYLNVGYQWEKIGMQLGLRAENVTDDALTKQRNGTNPENPNDDFPYNKSYNELYPSAFFTYQLNKKDQFSLSYSRRVDRPGIQQITPIREWQTATVTSIGNQDLKPQFTNSYELGYLRKLGNKGNINANVFYRKIKDNISRFLRIDPDNPNRTLMQFTNVDDNDAYGFELSGYYRPFKWWSFNASFDIFNNTLIGPDGQNLEQTLEIENTVWNGRISNDFKLSKSLNLQLFSMYRGKNKFLQGEMQDMFRLDVGLRKSFAQGKGSVSARVSDIFNTFYAQAVVNNPQNQIGEFRWESRSIYLGLNYSFGGKVKTRADKQQNRSDSGNSGGGIGF